MYNSQMATTRTERLPALIERERKREAARLVELGIPDTTIAAKMGIELPQIGKLRDDPEIEQMIAEIQIERRVKAGQHADSFDALMESAFTRLSELIGKPDATLDDVRKLFSDLADRHPSGQFAKQSKTTAKVTGKVQHDHTQGDGTTDVYARAASLPAPQPYPFLTAQRPALAHTAPTAITVGDET